MGFNYSSNEVSLSVLFLLEVQMENLSGNSYTWLAQTLEAIVGSESNQGSSVLGVVHVISVFQLELLRCCLNNIDNC